jgi:hypothetical protein
MGARFWFDMSDAAINASKSPAWEKTIARAMHDYGGYMGDTGGPGFGFQFESGLTYSTFHAGEASSTYNPYVKVALADGIKDSGPDYGYVFKFGTVSPSNGGIDWKAHMHLIPPPAQQ